MGQGERCLWAALYVCPAGLARFRRVDPVQPDARAVDLNRVDGGLIFIDGRPLFGVSKTMRGILLAVLATSAAAPLIGLPVTIGALVAAAFATRLL
jgi:hypothetical protein